MSDFPLEMSDDARIWLNRTLQQLENGLQSESQFLPSFSDPTDPVWAVFAARELIESWETYHAGETRFAQATLERLIQRVAQWLRASLGVSKLPPEEIAFQKLITVQAATELFLKVRNSRHGNLDGSLLQIAFASGHPTAIQMGMDFLLQAPPQAWTSASLALSPLLQYDDWDVELVFPRILESSQPAILASALDIANHLYSTGRLDPHPCACRFEDVVSLLGGIVQRLGVMEEDPGKFGQQASEVQKILFDSVSLCVSLCHTLSLLDNDSCIGKLMQASELRHRRIRTEAAFALAKLNQPRGTDLLVELAADPASRARALAYATELGCSDRIDEKHKTILAQAESQLAHWLAQVEQMGIAPTRIEFLEQRTLPWPGFETPQECFLFRFGYSMSDGEYSNVGLAGPVAKAFAQDLANISTDDAFAIFAGWDIEHPEIYERDASRLPTSVQEQVREWIETSLADEFEFIEPAFVGTFFEQQVLVGFGTKDDRKQPFAYDGTELVVCPSLKSNSDAMQMLYYLWRGRAFFHAFG